jgi:hypothetical protein
MRSFTCTEADDIIAGDKGTAAFPFCIRYALMRFASSMADARAAFVFPVEAPLPWVLFVEGAAVEEGVDDGDDPLVDPLPPQRPQEAWHLPVTWEAYLPWHQPWPAQYSQCESESAHSMADAWAAFVFPVAAPPPWALFAAGAAVELGVDDGDDPLVDPPPPQRPQEAWHLPVTWEAYVPWHQPWPAHHAQCVSESAHLTVSSCCNRPPSRV